LGGSAARPHGQRSETFSADLGVRAPGPLAV